MQWMMYLPIYSRLYCYYNLLATRKKFLLNPSSPLNNIIHDYHLIAFTKISRRALQPCPLHSNRLWIVPFIGWALIGLANNCIQVALSSVCKGTKERLLGSHIDKKLILPEPLKVPWHDSFNHNFIIIFIVPTGRSSPHSTLGNPILTISRPTEELWNKRAH